MKKTAIIFTAVTAALGAAGAALHGAEIRTALDPANGLAVRFAPITLCMVTVAILAMIITSALTFLVKGRSAEPVYHIAFAQRTPAAAAIASLSGLAMIVGAYICFSSGIGYRSSEQLALILSVFAALSGVSCIVLSIMTYRKKSGVETMFFTAVTVFFHCLWLVVTYLEKSAYPAMISYAYDYLAICAAAVASYYTAGYAFGRSRPGRTLAFSMAAAFFGFTAMPTALTPAFSIFYAASSVYQLVNIFLLANNLRRTPEEE